METMKKRGRIKIFSCLFNPTVVGEDESPLDGGESRRRKKTANRSFSGLVKAVSFKTPLLKKLRSKRSKQDSYRSSTTKLSSKLKNLTKRKLFTKKNSDPDEIFRDNSNRSSLFSSTSNSSFASSVSSNSRSGSERITCPDSNQASAKNKLNAVKMFSGIKCDYNHFTVMFIILVCLVALVFWGKALAIVTCTSAWLVLAPSRVGPRGGPGPAVEDSEEYKKKVIMEGLLERNIRYRVVRTIGH